MKGAVAVAVAVAVVGVVVGWRGREKLMVRLRSVAAWGEAREAW